MDYSTESQTAQSAAIRDRNAIEGRACQICPTGETEEGEEICPDCEADNTADIKFEVSETLKEAA